MKQITQFKKFSASVPSVHTEQTKIKLTDVNQL